MNASDGICLGRFGRGGIDIHTDLGQDAGQELQSCLDCTHARPGLAEWLRFVEGMQTHHNVTVDLALKPQWVKD